MSRNFRKCVICDKKEYGTYKAHFYFTTFPKEESRCREWLKVVGKEELTMLSINKLHKSRYICKDHFEKKHMNKKENRVKKSAIPTLNLKFTPLTNDQLKVFDQNIMEMRKGSLQQTDTVSTSEFRVDVNPDVPVLPEKTKEVSGTKLIKPTKRKIESTPKHTHQEETAEMTPRKRKLLEQLQKTKCAIRPLRKTAKLIEKLDSPVLKSLVLAASSNQNKKPQGRRWSTQDKISCLSILKRSTKTYKYLSHLMPLPSIKTLQNVLKNMPLGTGINNAAIDYLSTIATDKNEKEKVCCLLFDEIALKRRLIYDESIDYVVGYQDLSQSERCEKVADHAMVFMLQGVYSKFKQPIALYLVKGTMSSDKLYVKIKEIINKVSSTGYRIIATVCDQGSTNMGALKMLKNYSGQPTEDNWFLLNGNKHYIIYDIPHLLKSVRNNFQNNGTILYDGKTGKWEHILETEELNRNFLYLSKLSPTHVNPKYRAKMKVKYAAQTLSNTVSAVLKLQSKIEEGKNNNDKAEQLLDTALIIHDLDCLFDSTNGPSGPKDIKKGIRQNVSNKTNHLLKWSEYIRKLGTVKFIKKNGSVNNNVKCIQGFMITIKSLSGIWEETRSLGFKYLNLRQLNQDALENLFGLVRQHSPTNRNPTCYHFMIALKTSIISNMTAPHSRGSNCENDNGRLLTNFHNLLFHKNENATNDNGGVVIDELEMDTSDINTISIPDEMEDDQINDLLNSNHDHAAVYVSGYVAKTILKKSTCEACLLSLTSTNYEDDMYLYIKLREWWTSKKSLTYPSKSLYSTIKQMVEIMEKYVIPDFHKPNIKQVTITAFYAHLNVNWFKCTIHAETIHLIYECCALLLIRRQCQIINKQFASQEENLADSVKKAQQFGQGV